jgi:hypothetical protein
MANRHRDKRTHMWKIKRIINITTIPCQSQRRKRVTKGRWIKPQPFVQSDLYQILAIFPKGGSSFNYFSNMGWIRSWLFVHKNALTLGPQNIGCSMGWEPTCILTRANKTRCPLGEPQNTISNPYLHEFNKVQKKMLTRASRARYPLGEPQDTRLKPYLYEFNEV